MNAAGTSLLRFLYTFEFEDGSRKQFEVDLDAETLELVPPHVPERPDWTRLSFNQCENCPLAEDVEYCPVAVNLAPLAQEFQDSISFERIKTTVEAPERTYTKTTALQKALSSLVGLIMVTSNCPIMDRLRPMVRFHLPFAGSLDTAYRALSMYLIAQFFKMKNGKEADWDLKDLVKTYRAISQVNKGISKRLSEASNKDANLNAIVILHSVGDALPYFVEHGFEQIEPLFEVYTNGIADSVPARPSQK